MRKANMGAQERDAFMQLLAEEVRGRTDIRFFAKERLGIELNEFQEEWLMKTTTPRSQWMEKFGIPIDDIGGFTYGSNISSIGNQSGKTIATAIKHIWFCYYKIGMELSGDMMDTAFYASLNLSPHSKQTQACFNYIKNILEGNFIIHEEQGDGSTKQRLNEVHPTVLGFLIGENATVGELRFRNGSVMYSTSTGHDQASSIQGLQYGYISYDECSQSLHLKEELGAKIMSRLIRYGCCLDLIATPEVDSPSHQYYLHIVRLGQQGREGWWALTNMGMDNNRFISSAQREKAKKSLMATDPIKYLQVVRGEFVSGGKRFFDASEVEHMWQLPERKRHIPGHKYLLSADWGMSDTGDKSVFMVFDYTSYALSNRIELVAHESVKGGSPQMQFAMLRTLYDDFTDTQYQNPVPPVFVMDAAALGGVVIKKLLVGLKPHGFDIEKDIALFETKRAMGFGRDYVQDQTDGSLIERNGDYGMIRSYYIDELSEQMGVYHVDDRKLETDFVMAFMMGISYIVKKIPRGDTKTVMLSSLAGRQANQVANTRDNQMRSTRVIYR